MAKLIPALGALVLLIGAFFLPEGSPARLAALQAHQLLDVRVGTAPAEGEEDTRRTLWEEILAGPAVRKTEDGKTELKLYGVRIDGKDADLALFIELRRSLVRGFRERGGEDLVLIGENAPEPNGATIHVQVQDEGLAVNYHVHNADYLPDVVLDVPWSPPDRTSILPPLVAVALAVVLRRPLVALFAGVLVGAFLMRRAADAGVLTSAGGGFYDVFANYFYPELIDPERMMIILFVVFMLAMVGVMTRSGGIRGLMDAVARRADDVRKTQVATWLMGLVVFFDDYANTILVGSTMRPLTDRFRIAREKLAYIVDSTAAPVAGLSIFSTWIAFEVSTFSAQLPAAGLDPGDGYAVFMRTIPYSFYCILTLVFVGFSAWSGRDLGPMLTAERRARTTGALLRPGATPMVSDEATAMEAAAHVTPRASRALVPLLVFITVTLFEIARAGGAFSMAGSELLSIEGITAVLGDGAGSWPLMIGSGAGLLVAAVFGFAAGLGGEVAQAAWRTLRAMGVAFAILYLAWMIGRVCSEDHLRTAPYLTSLIGDSIDPLLLPSLVFLLAGLVALATGSSWSTMSILLPLVVVLAYNLGLGTGLAETEVASGQLLMVICIAAVLSGSIFGDHCSPISDTTVMSSIASASDHIDHVRTQAPYAILVMLVSTAVGYLPATYFGLSPWISLVLGAAMVVALLLWFGKRVEPAPSD